MIQVIIVVMCMAKKCENSRFSAKCRRDNRYSRMVCLYLIEKPFLFCHECRRYDPLYLFLHSTVSSKCCTDLLSCVYSYLR